MKEYPVANVMAGWQLDHEAADLVASSGANPTARGERQYGSPAACPILKLSSLLPLPYLWRFDDPYGHNGEHVENPIVISRSLKARIMRSDSLAQ